MPDSRDPRSVVEAAEQAAAAGDYPSAEQLLRKAALLQEASLGPLHPDLANTLNNLGIVCEMLANPEDAEFFYRKAYKIATTTLEPDNPFVATSRKNLVDFCEARGIAVETAPPPAPRPEPPAPQPEAEPPAPRPVQLPRESVASATPRPARSPFPLAIGVVVIGALVFAVIMAVRSRPDSTAQVGSSAAEPAGPSPATSPAPGPTPGPAAKPLPIKPAPIPNDNKTGVADPKSDAARTSAETSPLVVEARVCKDLSTRGDWSCDRPVLPVSQGAVFFYTRLKSERDTTVQHRWYRGDRLQQTMELRVQANPGDGYRTYSRRTVYNGGESNWKVELRTKDGVLLHEERFTVR